MRTRTFEDIYNSIITDWCNKLGISVDEAGYDIITISKVIALSVYQNAKITDAFQNNIWVGSMQADKLIEVGQDKIGRSPYLAVKGEYICSTIVTATGTIPQGSTFTKTINGTIYSFQSTQTVAAGSDITVRALTAGLDSALIVNDVLTSKQNLGFAENDITVLSIIEVPKAAETIKEYRAVVVAAEKLRLGNGNASDYILWVTNVNGMRTAYPYTAPSEAGKAVIYCEGSDSAVLVPSTALINETIDAIKYDIDGISQPPVEFFEFVNTDYIKSVQITGIKIQLTGGNIAELSTIQSLIRAYLLIKRPFLSTVNKDIVTSENYSTLENTISVIDIINILSESDITFTDLVMVVDILNVTGYVEKSRYVVGYRGGDTFPTPVLPSNDPTLSTYYGEVPRLEQVEFL
jgi:hypothetical protein